MDCRDDLTWVALELTYLGEQKVEDETLKASLLKDLNCDNTQHPVFIPSTVYYKSGKPITVHLLEGYVFVATGLPEVSYFGLEKQPYINKVLSEKGPNNMRTLSVISNTYIFELKSKLRKLLSSDLEVNQDVKVLDGLYRTLKGKVLSLEEDYAAVNISLRSIDLIARIPRVFLESLES